MAKESRLRAHEEALRRQDDAIRHLQTTVENNTTRLAAIEASLQQMHTTLQTLARTQNQNANPTAIDATLQNLTLQIQNQIKQTPKQQTPRNNEADARFDVTLQTIRATKEQYDRALLQVYTPLDRPSELPTQLLFLSPETVEPHQTLGVDSITNSPYDALIESLDATKDDSRSSRVNHVSVEGESEGWRATPDSKHEAYPQVYCLSDVAVIPQHFVSISTENVTGPSRGSGGDVNSYVENDEFIFLIFDPGTIFYSLQGCLHNELFNQLGGKWVKMGGLYEELWKSSKILLIVDYATIYTIFDNTTKGALVQVSSDVEKLLHDFGKSGETGAIYMFVTSLLCDKNGRMSSWQEQNEHFFLSKELNTHLPSVDYLDGFPTLFDGHGVLNFVFEFESHDFGNVCGQETITNMLVTKGTCYLIVLVVLNEWESISLGLAIQVVDMFLCSLSDYLDVEVLLEGPSGITSSFKLKSSKLIEVQVVLLQANMQWQSLFIGCKNLTDNLFLDERIAFFLLVYDPGSYIIVTGSGCLMTHTRVMSDDTRVKQLELSQELALLLDIPHDGASSLSVEKKMVEVLVCNFNSPSIQIHETLLIQVCSSCDMLSAIFLLKNQNDSKASLTSSVHDNSYHMLCCVMVFAVFQRYFPGYTDFEGASQAKIIKCFFYHPCPTHSIYLSRAFKEACATASMGKSTIIEKGKLGVYGLATKRLHHSKP